MSQKCLTCFRSIQNCYCKYIKSFDPKVKFVFLMHPVEAYKQKTGTGRLASLTLQNSEIIIGTDFKSNKRFNQLISDKQNLCFILYPGKDSINTDQITKEFISNKYLVFFLIDATWISARKMVYRNPILQDLHKISFKENYKSNFRIKKQPMDYCLSTIETCYYLLEELKDAGICNQNLKNRELINIFEKMVDFQIESRKKRLDNISK